VSPCSTSSRRRAPAPFRVPLPSVRGLSPSSRVLPETAAERFGLHGPFVRPLSWGLAPYSGRQRKGSVFPGASHFPGTLRLQGSTLLTPSLPFTPSTHSWAGRSWDCDLQGFTPPGDPDPLSSARAFLAVA
jgi:hypothetical protein